MEIALLVTTMLGASFLIAYIHTFKKFKFMSKAFAELLVTYMSLSSLVEENIETPQNKKDEDIHKENFIKFLSDSRDWAFDYIEDVQTGIGKFVSDVEKDIEYFDKYGDVLSVNRVEYQTMKRISTAFKELKTLLPEESNDRR
jgi:hypothetical protein